MEKILTIVIPTYNMQDYLRRCLDSLIVPEEQMQRLEVLVVNDGSKDNSSAIAHEYQNKYPDTFRVIDKENGNYGSCVNRGMKEATGLYFRILDADDWVDTEGLITFINRICSDTFPDVFVTNYTVVDCIHSLCKKSKLKGLSYDKLYLLDDTDLSLCNDIVLMHTLTYKTSILKDNCISLQEGISYTDTEYVYFPLKFAKNIMFLDIILYQYFLGRDGQSVSSAVSSKSIGNYYKILNRLLNDYISLLHGFIPKQRLFNISIPLYNIARAYFVNSIIRASYSEENDIRMHEVLLKIKDNDIRLFENLLNTKSCKVPYIKLWYRHHVYFSQKPYKIIWNFIEYLKKVL